MEVAMQAPWTPENWRERYRAIRKRIYTPTRPQDRFVKPVAPPPPVIIIAPPKRVTIAGIPTAGDLRRIEETKEARRAIEAAIREIKGDLPEFIIRTVADYFNVKPVEIVSERRSGKIVKIRFIAVYLCKLRTTFSLPRLGQKFGNRDHTTIMHSIKVVEKHIGSGDEYDLAVRELTERLDARRVTVGVEDRQEVGGGL